MTDANSNPQESQEYRTRNYRKVLERENASKLGQYFDGIEQNIARSSFDQRHRSYDVDTAPRSHGHPQKIQRSEGTKRFDDPSQKQLADADEIYEYDAQPNKDSYEKTPLPGPGIAMEDIKNQEN